MRRVDVLREQKTAKEPVSSLAVRGFKRPIPNSPGENYMHAGGGMGCGETQHAEFFLLVLQYLNVFSIV